MMDENKLTKKELIGYVSLWILIAALSYLAIYGYVRCSGFLSLEFSNSVAANHDREFYSWIIILLILSIILWLAGIASLIFHCVRLIKGNRENLFYHTLIEVIAIACSAAGAGELVFSFGRGFDLAPGKVFYILCFILFFISAAISLGILYLNTFCEKKISKRLKTFIIVGTVFVAISILTMFIPNVIVTFLGG